MTLLCGAIRRMGEGKKRVLRKSALVFDDPLEAYEHARKVRASVVT